MTAVAIIQARMGSSRLPGKVLMDLSGPCSLERTARAAAAARGVDRVAIATSRAAGDDAIAEWCASRGIACHRGPEDDVLARYVVAARAENAGIVLRITADCPFLDPEVVSSVLLLLKLSKADYAANTDPPSWPDGLDCEAMLASALYEADREAERPSDREHVTPFIRHNRGRFRVENLIGPWTGLADERWTLDTPADLAFLRAVAAHLPADRPAVLSEVLEVLERHPELRRINAGQIHNEGLALSIRKEIGRPVSTKAGRSAALRTRFRSLASDEGPVFTHADGALVWDADGNEYVDLTGGNPLALLGHRAPAVDRAIRRQLIEGMSVGSTTRLFGELAEELVAILPAIETIRFGRSRSEVLADAAGTARATTGRQQVLWVGPARLGIPGATTVDSTAAATALQGDDVAAVVIDGLALYSAPGDPAGLAAAARGAGAIVVLDESVTWPRVGFGGAHGALGIGSDLICLAGALGGGLSLAALGGPRRLMTAVHEHRSGGGDGAAAAAGLASLQGARANDVPARLAQVGARLEAELAKLGGWASASKFIRFAGPPAWRTLVTSDHPTMDKAELAAIVVTGLREHGVHLHAAHGVTAAHGENEIGRVLWAYEQVLTRIEQLGAGGLSKAGRG